MVVRGSTDTSTVQVRRFTREEYERRAARPDSTCSDIPEAATHAQPT